MIATNSYLTLLSLEVTILHPNTGEIWIKSLLSWVQITDAEIVSKKKLLISLLQILSSTMYPQLTQNMATQHAQGFEWVVES